MPGDKNDKYTNQTFLYIRTNAADDGTEPLPSSLQGWLSPDIVVIKPDLTRGSEAEANAVNNVEVTVTNGGGIVATQAYVELYVADPTTSIIPATATLIGGGYLNVQSWSTQSIVFPWIPSGSHTGHQCLLARVCLFLPPDFFRDATVFDVYGDRHVAQRNINVLPAAGERHVTGFGFNISNPGKKRAEFTVIAEEISIEKMSKQTRKLLGIQFAKGASVPLKNITLVTNRELADKYMHVQAAHDEMPAGEFKMMGYKFGILKEVPDIKEAKQENLKIEPNTSVPAFIVIKTNDNIEEGCIRFINIIQKDSKTKKTIGGLSFIFQESKSEVKQTEVSLQNTNTKK